jgi:hypothetical protein
MMKRLQSADPFSPRGVLAANLFFPINVALITPSFPLYHVIVQANAAQLLFAQRFYDVTIFALIFRRMKS